MVTADAPGIARLLTAPDALIGDWADLRWVRESWGRITVGEHHPEWLAPLWRAAAAEVWLQAQADPGFVDTALGRPDVPAPSVRRVALD
jgi:hypothetical protein